MKGVIVCGGKGTRMGEQYRLLPKSLVPVAGKPILHHQLEYFVRQGVTDIILCVGYAWEQIKASCGDGSMWGAKLTYSVEDNPLGTAGAVKLAEDHFQEPFLVLYGDIMPGVALEPLIRFHKKHGGVGTLVVHPNDHPRDSDLIACEVNGRIKAFLNKPHPSGRVAHNIGNACLYVLESKILAAIPSNIASDFAHDIFPKLLQEGLYGYRTREYLKDMGTSERLVQVEQDVRTNRIEKFMLTNSRPAIFLDRDGVIVQNVGHLHQVDQLRLLPGVTEALRMINCSEYLAVIVTNQPVVARGSCTLDELDHIHAALETALGDEQAYLDALYFCPHHPDEGFPGENQSFKIVCDCRKPGIGMFKQAQRELNIDLTRSFIIGDSTTDLQAGINAGVMPIGVRTGDGCTDGKCDAHPVELCADMRAAVTWILRQVQL